MDTSVSMIEVDTGKSFDISVALNKIRMEYEKSVQQHREEAEAYYKLKVSTQEVLTLSKCLIILASQLNRSCIYFWI